LEHLLTDSTVDCAKTTQSCAACTAFSAIIQARAAARLALSLLVVKKRGSKRRERVAVCGEEDPSAEREWQCVVKKRIQAQRERGSVW
jgi:hypothetical protein